MIHRQISALDTIHNAAAYSTLESTLPNPHHCTLPSMLPSTLNCTLLSSLHCMLPSMDSNALDCTPSACWTTPPSKLPSTLPSTLPSMLNCTLPSILPSMLQIMLLMILDCTHSAHLPVCSQIHSQAVLLSAGTRHRVGCSGQGVAGKVY